MKCFVVIAIILTLSFFGYRYFNGKKVLPHTSSGSEGSSVSVMPKVVNNTSNPDTRKDKDDITRKFVEWRKMVADMRTVLNNIKEMQEEPLKGKQ